MPPLEIFESDSSDRDSLKAPAPKAFKSRARWQRFDMEDVVRIPREGHLSP